MASDARADGRRRYEAVAEALARDVDLDRLAAALGATKKYRWEEPMVLSPADLSVVADRGGTSPRVYVYAFGSAVFLNCAPAAIAEFHARASRVAPIFEASAVRATDDYVLTTGDDAFEVTNDYARVPGADAEELETVCLVLAKSVALDRIEQRLDEVFDEIEHLIDYLAKGRLRYPDERMAKLTSMILSLQYTSISHVMVLDKPESTWESVEADRLYRKMAEMFELTERYHEIRHKSETLLDVTQVFSTLSHARRSTRLEVVVIVLILIEVLFYVVELVVRSH